MTKQQFIPNGDQGFKIAEFMPTGKAWDAKTDLSSNLGKLLSGLGADFFRLESLVQTVNRELDVNFCELLIREWESSVGIPDDCFSINETIEVRRRQVIAKVRNVRLQTAQDWVDLAALFGVEVQVRPGVPRDYIATTKEKRFSITINLQGSNSGKVFPFPEFFPIPFTSVLSSFIRCLFDKLKPANVQIIYRFGLNEIYRSEAVGTASHVTAEFT